MFYVLGLGLCSVHDHPLVVRAPSKRDLSAFHSPGCRARFQKFCPSIPLQPVSDTCRLDEFDQFEESIAGLVDFTENASVWIQALAQIDCLLDGFSSRSSHENDVRCWINEPAAQTETNEQTAKSRSRYVANLVEEQ
jgi:hypothetical protein